MANWDTLNVAENEKIGNMNVRENIETPDT